MATIKVIDLKNTAAGEIEIADKKLVAKLANQAIFDQVIAENAGKRQGTHSTLTKAEVRGGGKKPVPQKHTGNARQGSIRNPHYVGGGVVFGPKPNRNYVKKVNKKVSNLAMMSVLTQKIKAGQVIALKDDATKGKLATKNFANLLKLLKVNGARVLFAFNDKATITKARNIARVEAKLYNQVSVNDILKAKMIIFQEKGLNKIFGGKK